MEVNDLKGLPLGEAFRRYVLGDQEVSALGRCLIDRRVSYSAIFVDGRAPGPIGDFNWPLHATAENIADRFVDSILTVIGLSSPEPSELEREVAKALANRISSFVHLLVSTEMIAVGTFATTGVEAPIGAGQWTRNDLTLDVDNNALCGIRDHRPFELWTGVMLRASSPPHSALALPLQADIDASVSVKDFSEQTVKAETECVVWLETVIGISPNARTHTNAQLFEEAQSKWGERLGERAFYRALADAIRRKNAPAWKKGGRPRKTSAA